MHQAGFPFGGGGGGGTKYLRYRQQDKCGVINFHESQIGGEVISLGGGGLSFSELDRKSQSKSERLPSRRVENKSWSRALMSPCASSIFPFCRDSAAPAGNAETHTIYLLQLCGTLFFYAPPLIESSSCSPATYLMFCLSQWASVEHTCAR